MNAALIEILNQVKVYHWLSKDYNLHIILDQLYTSMSALLDRYMEARIGAGEKDDGPLVFKLVSDASKKNVLSAITRMYNTIIGLRKDCTVYEQCLILDDMLEAFGKAKYLGSMLGNTQSP